MARRRTRKLYPNAEGFLLRATRRNGAEERWIANSMSLRIGADLVAWLRETAARHKLTQGDLARTLLLAGREALESGALDLSANGRDPAETGKLLASDRPGR